MRSTPRILCAVTCCLLQVLVFSSVPAAARRSNATQAPMLHLGKPKRVIYANPHSRKKLRPIINPLLVAERQGYKAVSSLVPFPTFFPGLGKVYVKPATLPTGPFLCFDRKDRLMSTVYMIPITDFEEHKKFDLKRMAQGGDHLTIYFNGGHPGVTMPHYHVVVWHVSQAAEALVER